MREALIYVLLSIVTIALAVGVMLGVQVLGQTREGARVICLQAGYHEIEYMAKEYYCVETKYIPVQEVIDGNSDN